MVVCTATKPSETRQLPAMMKEPPELIDNRANPEPGDPVDEGGVAEEDREEGEIVDEFELIISSEDEEFKLRARIQQLEENNKDVERMDMLSANLAHEYNYPNPEPRLPSYRQKSPVLILSDVSSQSEDEFEAQRKYRKHKLRRVELGKRHHSSLLSDYRRNPFARRHKQLPPPPPVTTQRRRQTYHHHQQPSHQQHRHQQHYTLEDSLESDGELGEYDMNEDNEDDEIDLQRLKLSRDKLRVALAREDGRDFVSQYKNSLRERLQYRMHKSPSPPHRKKYQQEEELPLPPLQALSDDGEEEPEQEEQNDEDPAELKLRLIALKSAILKKHLARKKRDAERAYSPTDMINRVHPAISNDDIDDLMEISPAASPEREQSPPRYSTDYAVDTKPVDMELAETDSDDQNKDVWIPWSNNWNSMDNAGGSWRCFYPNNLPPVSMPIVIDDENEEDMKMDDRIRRENMAYFDDEEIPPPPPPFHIPQMHLEDEDARDAMHLVDQHSNHSSITEMQSVSMENSQTHLRSLDRSQPDSSDDEAGALRAILLSNLRSCKPPPPPPTTSPHVASCFVSAPVPAAVLDSITSPVSAPALAPVPVPPPSPVSAPVSGSAPGPVAQLKEESNQENDSDDPEALRLLLLSSIAGKKRASGSKSKTGLSPEILKNAVRRFQTTELSIKDEDESQDQQPILEDSTKLEESTKIEESTKLEAENEIINEPVVEPIQLEAAPIHKEPMESPQPVTKLAIQVKQQTSPSTKIIKIIKPNKVINKKTTTKRKLPTNEVSGSDLSVKRPTTLMIKEPSAPLHSQTVITSSTRLITTVDPASIKVNKLIISLAEESAASDDDLELSSSFAYANTDIASPLSLAMGSFSGSTTRSNTPISEIAETAPSANNNLRRTVINEYFEKKIDDFLKQARSKAPVSNSPEAEPEKIPEKPKVEEKQPTIIPTPKAPPAKTTPVAVRHLPVASQKEYLRLIERMQMLEQKKVRAPKSAAPAPKSKVPTLEKPSPNNSSSPTTAKVVHNPASATITIKATSESENPLVKDTDSKSPKPKAKLNQPSKESRLKAFENSFIKIGGSMLVNLDKSLQMVEEAKKSKAIRLRCSQRLKELYAEMQTVKHAVKQEELKLARIQPEIQASHEIIISLKQKRHKLYTAAMDLGRGLRGADYRLLDEGKVAITSKSTQLTKEIRLYNSIVKYEDLKKLTDARDSHPNTVIEMESKTNPNEGPKDVKVLNPQDPTASEPTQPATQPEIGKQPETETEPAIGSQPEKETETPDDQAQDKPKSVSIKTSAPYTVTTMRELREEQANELHRDGYLGAYQTPMSRNYNSHLDVHATICPFDLMGRCEDADCSYLHLARPDFQNELPKTNLSLNN
ncbi:titin homolog [Drosophila suzukii]|uniref:Titin homolog n=1 Tax=Drosophila suzukii TaxID=28584 RepID=A0AB39Z7L4_DROSZ